MSSPRFSGRKSMEQFLGGTAGATRSAAAPRVTPAEKVAAIEASVGRDYQEIRDTAGTLRVRIGRQTDGKYGVRIWNSAGVLQIDQTYA